MIVANQANQRSQPSRLGAEPVDRQLTTGPQEADVITGAASDGDERDTKRKDRDRKVA